METETWIRSWRQRCCRGSMDLVVENPDTWILRNSSVKDPDRWTLQRSCNTDRVHRFFVTNLDLV